MKIYFVRHGETNYNVLGLCNSNPLINVYLTNKGKEQAKSVARKFEGIHIDKVIISELPRTLETANIIMSGQKFDPTIEPRINDRKTGFEDQPVLNYRKAVYSDITHAKFNDGESFQEEKERVISFLIDLENMNFKTVLVVAHGEIIRIINGYYNNLSDQEIWKTTISNAEILEITL